MEQFVDSSHVWRFFFHMSSTSLQLILDTDQIGVTMLGRKIPKLKFVLSSSSRKMCKIKILNFIIGAYLKLNYVTGMANH
jgi:hypothetical protein